jgi:hypothetical protein
MKFRVKVVTKSGARSVYEFDARSFAFKFAESLFDEKNAELPDPVQAVVIGPAP